MPIIELGPDGTVVGSNASARQAALDAQVPLAELLPHVDAGDLGQCARTGEPLTGLTRVLGGREWRWSLFPVDVPPGFYAYGHDRSAESRLELQVQHSARMESVGRLAAGVTHDINNILMAISGHTLLLERATERDPDCQEEIDGIKEQLERARELGKRLLLVSRTRVGDSVPEPVDLGDVLPQVATTVRHLLPSRMRSTAEVGEKSLWVRLDVREFERAMLNLAANAADACPNGGAFAIKALRRGRRAVIQVSDSGDGIPADILPRIFDPFFTTKPEGSGTGLGLAAVHSFVSASGGTISVESQPGAGTTFVITLPLAGTEGRAAVGGSLPA